MNLFDKLKRKHGSHPIFRNHDLRVKRSRKIANALSSEDLVDSFSETRDPEEGPKEKQDIALDGSMAVESAVRQFEWPLPPRVYYTGMDRVKFAKSNPRKVVDAEMKFSCDFATKTGATLQIEIPVKVARGEVVPPSTFYFEGRQFVLGQKTINSIIDRHTSYYNEPLRDMYENPLDLDEQQARAISRFEQGQKARENNGLYSSPGDEIIETRMQMMRHARKARDTTMLPDPPYSSDDVLEEIVRDQELYNTAMELLFESDNVEEFANKLKKEIGTYIRTDVDWISVASSLWGMMDTPFEETTEENEAEISKLMEQFTKGGSLPQPVISFSSFPIDSDEFDYYSTVAAECVMEFTEMPASDGFDYEGAVKALMEFMREDGVDFPEEKLREEAVGFIDDAWEGLYDEAMESKMEGSVHKTPKRALRRKKPTAYDHVVDLMDTAQELGVDTFPRMYEHIEQEYILDVINTANRDDWELHLINDHWAINPKERGYRRRAKKAQNLEEPELDKFEDEDIEEENIEEKIKSLNYPGTKTPMEPGDPVKFNGNGGPFQGKIVEVYPEENNMIIKSKGLEYRVQVEEIEALPSTHKKMYLE